MKTIESFEEHADEILNSRENGESHDNSAENNSDSLPEETKYFKVIINEDGDDDELIVRPCEPWENDYSTFDYEDFFEDEPEDEPEPLEGDICTEPTDPENPEDDSDLPDDYISSDILDSWDL